MLLKSFSYISKPVGFMLNKLLIKQWREEQENTQVCHIFLFFPLLFYAELANLKKKVILLKNQTYLSICLFNPFTHKLLFFFFFLAFKLNLPNKPVLVTFPFAYKEAKINQKTNLSIGHYSGNRICNKSENKPKSLPAPCSTQQPRHSLLGQEIGIQAIVLVPRVPLLVVCKGGLRLLNLHVSIILVFGMKRRQDVHFVPFCFFPTSAKKKKQSICYSVDVLQLPSPIKITSSTYCWSGTVLCIIFFFKFCKWTP